MSKISRRRPPINSEQAQVSSVRENILLRNQIPTIWPGDVEKLLVAFSEKSAAKPSGETLDLTKVPFVTIDGKDARDFDDAVYCREDAAGFKLDVAVADVSRYVERDGPLDLAARERGNSVYLPGRVVPMLPEMLSTDLCSLNPGEVRFALVCRMNLTHDGKIDHYEFVEARIQSAARLTYDTVSAFLNQPDSAFLDQTSSVKQSLRTLDVVSRKLWDQRRARGSLQLEFSETETLFDHDGYIEAMKLRPRPEAARVIEECMLAANICAGQALDRSLSKAIYRCHDAPDRDAIRNLKDIFGVFGVRIDGGSVPTGGVLSRALASAKKNKKPLACLQMLVLRSMKQAFYSPTRSAHYGLGFETYTHFTSPIRRYPDLIAHRLLKAVLDKEPMPGAGYDERELTAITDHCSRTERQAEVAEREMMTWLKAQFMHEYIGNVFLGTVSGVAGFGVFITLEEFPVEGMIHVSELGWGYFEFDQRHMSLVARETGERVMLGDRIRVKLAGVHLEDGKIDFARVLDDGFPPKPPRSRKRNRSRQNQARRKRAAASGRRH